MTTDQTITNSQPQRRLLIQIKNPVDNQTISQFDYANDALGRCTAINYSASAFNLYGYNTMAKL